MKLGEKMEMNNQTLSEMPLINEKQTSWWEKRVRGKPFGAWNFNLHDRRVVPELRASLDFFSPVKHASPSNHIDTNIVLDGPFGLSSMLIPAQACRSTPEYRFDIRFCHLHYFVTTAGDCSNLHFAT